MADAFNPYHRWLGIPLDEQPPDHYRLLGIKRFENDPHVITNAADRQMVHLRGLNIGPNAKVAEKLLTEVSAARICLLVPESKEEYDATLRAKHAAAVAAASKKGGTNADAAPRKSIPVARSLPASVPNNVPIVDEPAKLQAMAAAMDFVNATPKSRGSSAKKSGRSPITSPLFLAAAVGGVIVLGGLVFLFSGSGGKKVTDQRNSTAIKTKSPDVVEVPKSIPAQPKPAAVKVPDISAPPVTMPPSTDSTAATASSVTPSISEPAPPSSTTPANSTIPTPPSVAPKVSDVVSSEPLAPRDPPSPAQSEPPIKTKTLLPIPSEDERKRAEAQIREVFADKLKNAKTEADRLALARDLEQQGQDTSNAPEIRYAALLKAHALAVDANDIPRALALVTQMGELFAIPTVVEKSALLAAMSEKGRAVRAQALDAAEREFVAFVEADAFADAAEMGRAALTLAKAARDRDAVERLTSRASQLKRRKQAHLEFETATAQLNTNPTDEGAQLLVGRWWWFFKNDVRQGLAHLAKGNNAPLAAAAAADLANPQTPVDQKEIGDQWRTMAGQETLESKQHLLVRAKHWYQKSLPGLGGLEKARVEKYLVELNQQIIPAATSATPPVSDVAVEKARKPAAEERDLVPSAALPGSPIGGTSNTGATADKRGIEWIAVPEGGKLSRCVTIGPFPMDADDALVLSRLAKAKVGDSLGGYKLVRSTAEDDGKFRGPLTEKTKQFYIFRVKSERPQAALLVSETFTNWSHSTVEVAVNFQPATTNGQISLVRGENVIVVKQNHNKSDRDDRSYIKLTVKGEGLQQGN